MICFYVLFLSKCKFQCDESYIDSWGLVVVVMSGNSKADNGQCFLSYGEHFYSLTYFVDFNLS